MKLRPLILMCLALPVFASAEVYTSARVYLIPWWIVFDSAQEEEDVRSTSDQVIETSSTDGISELVQILKPDDMQTVAGQISAQDLRLVVDLTDDRQKVRTIIASGLAVADAKNPSMVREVDDKFRAAIDSWIENRRTSHRSQRGVGAPRG